MLMENRYVFNPFWQHHNGIDGFADWEDRFKVSARAFAHAFQAGDTAKVLSFVFDRLYVLRNQLVHGGSTWNSGVNRAQVRDGADPHLFDAGLCGSDDGQPGKGLGQAVLSCRRMTPPTHTAAPEDLFSES